MTIAPMLRVISLGAGVQSTTMAMMAAHGEISPMPDCAIFADTQAESAATYRHLDWLRSALPFPVHIVTAGDLGAQILASIGGRARNDGRPPVFVRNDDDGTGILRRQCTGDFKIVPIEREVRRLLGLKPGQRWPRHAAAEQWIGISTDEIIRARPSDRAAIVRKYPLIDARMNRWDCMQWLRRHDCPVPPKSACIFCPFRSNAEWREVRDDPQAWDYVIRVDQAVRAIPHRGRMLEGYLHQDLKPIDQVDLSTAAERGQADLFGNECEGMCGL
jgi:hypothetical protein